MNFKGYQRGIAKCPWHGDKRTYSSAPKSEIDKELEDFESSKPLFITRTCTYVLYVFKLRYIVFPLL